VPTSPYQRLRAGNRRLITLMLGVSLLVTGWQAPRGSDRAPGDADAVPQFLTGPGSTVTVVPANPKQLRSLESARIKQAAALLAFVSGGPAHHIVGRILSLSQIPAAVLGWSSSVARSPPA
jgi:predicted oxidoreductase